MALPQEHKPQKLSCIITLLIGLLGLLVCLAGAKCTTCVEDKNSQSQLVLISEIIFVISGVLILIPVYWDAHSIIQDFYNPLVVDDQKWDLGGSLSWTVSGLLLLCCACTSGEPQGPGHYMACSSASAPHSVSYGPSTCPT